MFGETNSNSPLRVSRDEYDAGKKEMIPGSELENGFYILRHQAQRTEIVSFFALDMLIKIDFIEETQEHYTVTYGFVAPHNIEIDESLSVAVSGIVFERYLAHKIVPRRKPITVIKEEVGYLLSTDPDLGEVLPEDSARRPIRGLLPALT